MTAVTVVTISASYSQIIELFPTGGGGYVVATKLLGPVFGLVSGCALVVDYMLTISISISSGVEAVLSFLPAGFFAHKLTFILLVTLVLVLLNLRGVKESVTTLMPIFLFFFVSHVGLILYGIFSHVSATPTLFVDTIRETRQGIQQLGFGAMAFILLRAYSLGGGTYTGIEAVANGLQILRPPRVKTGQEDDGPDGRLPVLHRRRPARLLPADQRPARRREDPERLAHRDPRRDVDDRRLSARCLAPGAHPGVGGGHPLRRRPDGLHRRPAGPGQHGHRLLGAQPPDAPFGAARRPERHPVHGPGLAPHPRLHAGLGPDPRRHVQHQRLPGLLAGPARHVPPLDQDAGPPPGQEAGRQPRRLPDVRCRSWS
ncbi:MAG: amino acid permease [Ignavibacteriales bacterium]|nr:amino acid permease [Ignavibacteriales bacterium]